MPSVSLIIVEKSGTLKQLTVKDYKEEELYKKCNFKKSEGFIVQTEWNTKLNGQKYSIKLYAKSDGKSGTENKYEFPPPVDSKLYFGACILVGYLRDDSNEKILFNLTVQLWTAIYEKIVGGFKNTKELTNNDDDEDDSDNELDNVSVCKEKKPKTNYLKDSFTVDSEELDEDDTECISESNSDVITDSYGTDSELDNICQNELIIDDLGSELSEESYDY